MTKIIGICATGTYYSPWVPWTIGSIYPICDEVVIVNGGYDLNDPKDDIYNVPVDKVSEIIKLLDCEHKITEIKHPNLDMLHHRAVVTTQKAINEYNIRDGYDVRGFNLTLANEIAVDKGANWILKIDSDQVLYNDALKMRESPGNYNLYQYEFKGDLKHLSVPPPNSPYNDSVFMYKAYKGQWYYAGGAPMLVPSPYDWNSYWELSQFKIENTDKFHSSHLRFANPKGLTDSEKFEHFRGRTAFSFYSGEFGKWCPELFEKASNSAKHLIEHGMDDAKLSDVTPPEITRSKL